jgi:hypothetical protein
MSAASVPAAALAASLALLLGFVGAALGIAVENAAPELLDTLPGRDTLLAGQLAALGVGLAWESLVGALVPAAGVVVSAAFVRAPCRPLHAVFLSLWLP